MWLPTNLIKLVLLKKKYKKVYGVDPDGDLGYCPDNAKEYINDLTECIKRGDTELGDLIDYGDDML